MVTARGDALPVTTALTISVWGGEVWGPVVWDRLRAWNELLTSRLTAFSETLGALANSGRILTRGQVSLSVLRGARRGADLSIAGQVSQSGW